MPGPTQIAAASKRAGKKVLATDTAQGVVGAVVDKLEEIAVDKADDAAETVKEKVAKAGGRAPKRSASNGKKSRAKKSSAKKSTAKKSTAKKSTAKKSSTGRASSDRTSTAKKSSTRKRPAARTR